VPRGHGWESALRQLRNATGFVLENAVYLPPALLFAVGLKYYYSQAGSDELGWILRPTARLVELFSGIRFEEEVHAGFISLGRRILIAPACAGVNFFIIAFCMAVFSGLRRIEQGTLKGLWLPASVAGAYLLTTFVNALRIIVSIYSYDADVYSGWITPERVHRLEGVLIYFFFLSLFYRIIETSLRRFSTGARDISRPKRAQSGHGGWMLAASVPLFWYLLVTVAVPLLNGGRFAEHSAMVVACCLIVLVSVRLAQAGWRRIGARIKQLKN
jgi:exosortase K